MANLKISELSALAGGDLVAADELAIVDDSASETKKITVSNLIANGVTLISDDSIPGAKILFAAGDIATAALADSAVTTVKIADDGVTGAKLADESTVDLVTTLPASGAFTGQLALDTDDNKLYLWNGTSWLSVAAAGSVNTVSGSTTGEVNIVSTVSGDTVTISATLDDTTAASQFLAGPTGSAGAVGYRAIDGNDLPVATTSAKGGVIVNGEGLRMDSNTIEVDNDVTASSTHHVVTYNAKGLVTGGRIIASSDLPIATTSARGAVIASDGLAVDASGNLSIDNTVTSGTYTKVTVTAQGVVSAGETLTADDIPNHSAAKLTSGTIGSSIIANDAVTASKLADQSITKFGGALGSDNVTIFPQGDFKGQFFYDETTQDLYIYTGSSFVPVTVLSGNLVNAGVYDASTNQMSSVTSAGSAAGFSVGAALPNPAGTNLNHYVVVGVSGTGSGAAPAVALAPPDMLLSQGVGSQYSLIDVSNAIAGQTASNISLITTGNITATDVQAGIQELDTEKLQKSGDTMTGALGIGTASSIVFEGSTADDYETTLTVTDPTADHTITLPDVTGTVVTTGDTGSVTSTMITDGTIVNADINASAEIAVSKLANGTARQLLQTDSGGTGVEFTSNVDVPGTLDVTNAAVFDSTITAAGLITANGKVSFSAGTAAAPSLYSGSDEDTGIYSPGSDQIALATNGTGRLFIDSSGNVGIGGAATASASTKTFQITDGTTARMLFESTGTGGRKYGWYTSVDGQFAVYDYTANSERMRIDSSGNVGIGTTAPGELLTVNGTNQSVLVRTTDLNGAATIKFNADNGNFAGIGLESSALVMRCSNSSTPTERARIDSSGRLLVGTSSARTGSASIIPSLQCESTAGSGSSSLFCRNSDSTSGPTLQFAKTRGTSNGSSTVVQSGDELGLILFSGADGTDIDSRGAQIGAYVDGTPGLDDMPGRLVFSTTADGASSPTERMRIDSSGRVGVGTNTPNAKFEVVESATGEIEVARFRIEGQTNNPMLRVLADEANQKITLDASGSITGTELVFAKGGSEAARIDSSGRLLVGTSNSSNNSLLQIKANASITTSYAYLSLQRGSAPGTNDDLAYIDFTDSSGNQGAWIQARRDGGTWTSGSSHPTFLAFSTTADGASSPTERMRIDSSGNVGIGTSPGAPLDINLADDRGIQATASVSSPSFIRSYQGEVSNNIRDIGLQGYTIRFETGINTGSTTTEAARIDSAGRLLVGTSTSVATSVGQPPIQVTTGQSIIRYSSTGSFPAVLDICHSKSNTIGTNTSLGDGDAIGRISYGGADGSSYVVAAEVEAFVDGTPGTNDMPGRLVFSTTADGASSPTERMRIDRHGYVLVGTSFINAHSTTTESQRGIALRRDAGILVGVTNVHAAIFARYGSNGECVRFQRDNVDVGSIDVTTTTTTYNTSSDYRLKENVVPLTGAVDRLSQLQVHRFNFIADPDKTVDGFIAHEAQAVVPECVTGTKDEVDDEGNPVYQGIDQAKLVPLLTAALQEAIGRIETLEAEVQQLKAQ